MKHRAADRPSSFPPGRGNASDWWRHGVFYQVYLRSFADGNGDGIGDIAGLIHRLPYLRSLGIDAIWVNIWYVSPLRDGGYDVADYRDIDPRFGSLRDAETLITVAHRMGIRVIADLVPNHTSSDHVWFREALATPLGSPERSRYHFRRGKGDSGSKPPNNWHSAIGGPAWERVADGEWYLHLFDTTQPDLNWAHPEVRAEFDSVLRFWMHRGLDGFRVDVAHTLTKDPDFPDLPGDPAETAPFPGHPHFDRDDIHEIVRRWRRVVDEYPGRMMVAEAVVGADRLARYLRPGEYHQAFGFPFLRAGWDCGTLRQLIPHLIHQAAAVGSIPTWVLSSHDVVRHVTRFGLPRGTVAEDWLLDGPHDLLDSELGLRRARAAALMMLALPGSVYLYQGEELGLPEVWDLPEEALDDPIWERSRHTRRGRDGCRVPIPWEAEAPSFGFSSGTPWSPQPAEFGPLAVDRQCGVAGSTFELYRTAIRLRRELGLPGRGFEMVDSCEDVIRYRRTGAFTCTINMGTEPIPLPPGRVLLVSGDVGRGVLQPNDAAWIGEP